MRFESVTEAFGAAKEVKVGGLEKFLLNDSQILPKFLLDILQLHKLLVKYQDICLK